MSKVSFFVAVAVSAFACENFANAVDKKYAAACHSANEALRGVGSQAFVKLGRDLPIFKTIFMDTQRVTNSDYAPNVSEKDRAKLGPKDNWAEYRKEARRNLLAYEEILNKKDFPEKAADLRRLEYAIHAFYAPELNRTVQARCAGLQKKDSPAEPCHWASEIYFETKSNKGADGNIVYTAEPQLVLCSLGDEPPHAPIGCLTQPMLERRVSDDVSFYSAFNNPRKAAMAAYLPKKKKDSWNVALSHSTSDGKTESTIFDEQRNAVAYNIPQPGGLSFGSDRYPNPEGSTLYEYYRAICDDAESMASKTEEEEKGAKKPGAVAANSDAQQGHAKNNSAKAHQ